LQDTLLSLKRSCEIALKFNFKIDRTFDVNKEFYLAIETASEFNMEVNGKEVDYKDIGWWKDSSFKKIDIKAFIKPGVNEVILKRKFFQAQKVYGILFGENILETEINKLTYDTELESIYLVGDFGVKSKSIYSKGERKAVFTDGPFCHNKYS